MKELWSRRVRDMTPYVPGEQPQGRRFIKLNTNENPYPPAPGVRRAVEAAAGEALRLYPDPQCMELRRAVARETGLAPEQVFCGNGSDEVLSFAFQAFFDKEDPITFPDITYSFYEVYVKYLDLTARTIPLNEDFTLPLARFLEEPTGGVVLANPNAPTGLALGTGELRQVVEAHPERVVLVDEAYVDFGAESMAKWVGTYPNLLVVQTASKSRALAGARVGWALGDPNLIAGLCCVRDSINSYTVDRLACAAAVAALEDRDYFDKTRREVQKTRERTREALTALGFEVLPSQANFLFVRHPAVPGPALFQGLRREGILVRRWDLPRIRDYLRISIGLAEDMETLVRTLGELADVRD